eukprot:238026-Amphidinium_carterae.8
MQVQSSLEGQHSIHLRQVDTAWGQLELWVQQVSTETTCQHLAHSSHHQQRQAPSLTRIAQTLATHQPHPIEKPQKQPSQPKASHVA